MAVKFQGGRAVPLAATQNLKDRAARRAIESGVGKMQVGLNEAFAALSGMEDKQKSAMAREAIKRIDSLLDTIRASADIL